MHRFLLAFLLCVSCPILRAQSIGQYEVRKRGSAGFTSYGVSLSDGQVIGQSSGIPAALTIPHIATASVAYVELAGDNSSAAVGDPTKPFATLQAAYNAGARVFFLGVGTFGDLTAADLDIQFIGRGCAKTIVGNISGTSGSIYGNGRNNITVGAITIQPAQAANGSTGNVANETPAGNGATGTDAANTTVAGLSTSSDVQLISGNGGNGGYAGDSSNNQGTATGGNGGNAGNCGTLTVIDCTLNGGWFVNYSGLGGGGGAGSNSTDNSSPGGNGGNGGNGGTPGTIIVRNCTGVSFYAGNEGAGSPGSGGYGSAPGNAGTAGNSSGSGTVTTYFTFAETAPANGETANLYASYIAGRWTSTPPSSAGGNGTADSGLFPTFRGDGSLYGNYFVAISDGTGTLTTYAKGGIYVNKGGKQIFIKYPDSITTGGTLSVPDITANSSLVTTSDSGSITNGMLAGSITFSKLVGTDITKVGTLTAGSIPTSLLSGSIADTALSFTDITTGNVSTSKHGYAPKLDGNSAHYLSGNGSWTTPSGGTGTVTSVAASVPSFLSISGSPITTSGTLAITLSGTALPVANGGTGQTTLQAAINALAAASGALSQGDILYYNGTNIVRLGAGTANYVLNTGGAGANPSWGTNAITIAGTSTALGGTITQDTITGLSSTGIVKRTAANTLAIATSGTDYLANANSLTQLGVSMANNTAITGIYLGTITDTTSRPFTISQTLNNSGLSAVMLNIQPTITSSSGNSKLFRIGTSSSDYFYVTEGGTFWTYGGGTFSSNIIVAGNTVTQGGVYANRSNTAQYWFGTGDDLILSRIGAAYLGLGVASGTPISQTLSGAQGSGSNITGGTLNIGTRGTGTGTGGTINLQSHSAGSSGSTLGTLVTKLSVGPNGTAIGSTGTPHSKIKSGTAVLVAGTVTVSDSDVVDTGTASTSSRILVTRWSDGGTMGDSYSITRSNGTSFTVTAKSAGATQTLDTSTVSWLMLNP